MRIFYVAAACSKTAYERLYADVKNKPAFQAQKYHRLFMEGLAQYGRVEAFTYPSSNPDVIKTDVVALPEETVGNVHYRYLPIYKNVPRKLLALCAVSFFRCLKELDRDSAVVIDCLNQAAGLGALLAARIRGAHCVGIVTDLPEFQGGGPMVALAEFLIRHCTEYVVLTEPMNQRVNPKGKPYVVLEGHADITMAEKKPCLDKKGKTRVCMYAGLIHKEYGIARLVEGFRLAAIPNTQLRIYGIGDYQEELEQIAAQDSTVVYGGMLLPSQVVEREMEATLLINPRPSDEAFTKFSFPSKTMEYMSTGTPVLMTRLPGLPKEYEPYVSFIEQEDAAGIAQALREVLSHSDEELFAMGCRAREFVLQERNNVVQAGKVLAMLEGKQV